MQQTIYGENMKQCDNNNGVEATQVKIAENFNKTVELDSKNKNGG